ncbi:MAG TPA: hypothetical protein VEN31_08690, partial [Candidatus Bathyarchaeia archaeon]|nr:hypothetical protein [Candidatus Bathyarchaeia archaeon]
RRPRPVNSKRFFAPLWLLILGTVNDLRSKRDVIAQFIATAAKREAYWPKQSADALAGGLMRVAARAEAVKGAPQAAEQAQTRSQGAAWRVPDADRGQGVSAPRRPRQASVLRMRRRAAALRGRRALR